VLLHVLVRRTGQGTIIGTSGVNWCQVRWDGSGDTKSFRVGDERFDLCWLAVQACSSSGSCSDLRAHNWIWLCDDGPTATVPPNSRVRYGAYGGWVQRVVSGDVAATNDVFGDPNVGMFKALYLFALDAIADADADADAGLAASTLRSWSEAGIEKWVQGSSGQDCDALCSGVGLTCQELSASVSSFPQLDQSETEALLAAVGTSCSSWESCLFFTYCPMVYDSQCWFHRSGANPSSCSNAKSGATRTCPCGS
jgi:hypothetical protein